MTEAKDGSSPCETAADGCGCFRVEAVLSVDERGQMVLPKEIRERAGIGAGEAPAISFTRGVKLDFGQRSHENVGGLGLDVLDTTLSTFIGIQCEMLIGMPIFRQMSSFTVDFPKRQMWIEWLEPE